MIPPPAVTTPLPLPTARRPGRAALAAFGLGAGAAALAWSLGRTALNYGTETDFLGSFVPDAARIAAGEPPALEYHPPLYPALLALVHALTGDWLRSGLVLSLLAAAACLPLAHRAFAPVHGEAAGLGALAALLVSGTFLSYAVQASGDVPFLALVLGVLAALASARTGSPRAAALAGALSGLAVLARTNGVAVVAFAAGLPFGPRGRRLTAAYLGGLAAPLALWAALAGAWGAPLLPRGTSANLALTYLAEGDRTSGDAMHEAAAGVDGASEVLLRHPRRVARVFARDLLTNLRNVFREDLLFFPFAELSAAGLAVLLARCRERRDVGLLAGTGAMFLLLNLKAWEGRYHLYLVPVLGAGLGLLVAAAARVVRSQGRGWLVVAGVVAGALFAGLGGWRVARESRGDLGFDAEAAARLLPPHAVVVARKPHLCYHARLSDCEVFPDVEDLGALRRSLRRLSAARPAGARVFLFYGFAERTLRPGLDALARRELRLPWLTQVAVGKENGKWVLYELDRTALAEERP